MDPGHGRLDACCRGTSTTPSTCGTTSRPTTAGPTRTSWWATGYLQQFLSVFGFELDTCREFVESWQHVYDVDWSPIRLLRKLGQNFGLDYEQGVGDIRYRSLFSELGRFYEIRGTQTCLEGVIRRMSKYHTTVTAGSNLMLLPDDSDFYQGTGQLGRRAPRLRRSRHHRWPTTRSRSPSRLQAATGRGVAVAVDGDHAKADGRQRPGHRLRCQLRLGLGRTGCTIERSRRSRVASRSTLACPTGSRCGSSLPRCPRQRAALAAVVRRQRRTASAPRHPRCDRAAQHHELGTCSTSRACSQPPAGAVYVVPYILFDTRTDDACLHDVQRHRSTSPGRWSTPRRPSVRRSVRHPTSTSRSATPESRSVARSSSRARSPVPPRRCRRCTPLYDAWAVGTPVPTAVAPSILGITPDRAAAANDAIYWNGTAWVNIGPISSTFEPFILGSRSSWTGSIRDRRLHRRSSATQLFNSLDKVAPLDPNANLMAGKSVHWVYFRTHAAFTDAHDTRYTGIKTISDLAGMPGWSPPITPPSATQVGGLHDGGRQHTYVVANNKFAKGGGWSTSTVTAAALVLEGSYGGTTDPIIYLTDTPFEGGVVMHQDDASDRSAGPGARLATVRCSPGRCGSPARPACSRSRARWPCSWPHRPSKPPTPSTPGCTRSGST